MEAARLACVSRKSIYRWIKAGILEHCVLPSGTIRIYQESLLRTPGIRTGRSTASEERAPARSRSRGRAAAPRHRRHST
jgi:predicted site-specific integrase-resolvase